MTQEEQYKSFIKYCSNARKSINNYSDFKRINETIAKIKGVEKYEYLLLRTYKRVARYDRLTL